MLFSPLFRFTGRWIRFSEITGISVHIVKLGFDCPVDKIKNFSTSRILSEFKFGEFTNMENSNLLAVSLEVELTKIDVT